MGKAKVLVVDDESIIRDAVLRILAPLYEVRTCCSGEEALLASPQDFNILVTDKKMPGISGLELIQRLRKGGFDGATILMTAAPSEEVRSELVAYEQCPDMVLFKPFGYSELIGAVFDCVALTQLRAK
ncbi:MAG: response regulator [bacterium]